MKKTISTYFADTMHNFDSFSIIWVDDIVKFSGKQWTRLARNRGSWREMKEA